MTELWVPDRDGKKRDVILGYDDNVCVSLMFPMFPLTSNYLVAVVVRPCSPSVQRGCWKVCFGCGHYCIANTEDRYANRLKNGTFSIPIVKNDPPNGTNVWHIPTNDHDGQVTLHGGKHLFHLI